MKRIRFALALFLSLFAVFASYSYGFGDLMNDMIKEGKNGSEEEKANMDALESVIKVVTEIEPEDEYFIGRTVAATITAQYPVYKKAPKATLYLNRICAALTMNSEQPYLYNGYHVAIIDTDEINAMATPGGHIFVSRGLIKACDSEDALAAVLAHEIGHIQLKHNINAIKTNRVTDAAGKIGKATLLEEKNKNSDLVKIERVLEKSGVDVAKVEGQAMELYDNASTAANTLVNSGYSQSQEFKADETALNLMVAAGYDPNAMVDMLNLISGNTETGGWNSTHPKPQDRIKKVNAKLKKLNKTYTFTGKEERKARFQTNTAELQ